MTASLRGKKKNRPPDEENLQKQSANMPSLHKKSFGQLLRISNQTDVGSSPQDIFSAGSQEPHASPPMLPTCTAKTVPSIPGSASDQEGNGGHFGLCRRADEDEHDPSLLGSYDYHKFLSGSSSEDQVFSNSNIGSQPEGLNTPDQSRVSIKTSSGLRTAISFGRSTDCSTPSPTSQSPLYVA